MDLDQSVIGVEGPVFIFEVEKGHIRKFASAIGDTNPLYLDEAAAAKTPYGGMIAPPTFPIVVGTEGGAIPLMLDERRMLHGEHEFEYFQPIRPGDRLCCQMKVKDLFERDGRSGSMQFLVIDTEMKDEAGQLIAISRMTIIYRKLAS